MKNPLIDIESLKKESLGEIKENAVENGRIIKEAFKGSFDIKAKKAYCGEKCVVFANCDGLCDAHRMSDIAIKPIMEFKGALPSEDIIAFICSHLITGTEQALFKTLDDAVDELLRGNLIIFIEGERECISVGVQKLPERSIDEPDTDVQEFGAR